MTDFASLLLAALLATAALLAAVWVHRRLRQIPPTPPQSHLPWRDGDLPSQRYADLASVLRRG